MIDPRRLRVLQAVAVHGSVAGALVRAAHCAGRKASRVSW
jgi:hypothetical protein